MNSKICNSNVSILIRPMALGVVVLGSFADSQGKANLKEALMPSASEFSVRAMKRKPSICYGDVYGILLPA